MGVWARVHDQKIGGEIDVGKEDEEMVKNPSIFWVSYSFKN